MNEWTSSEKHFFDHGWVVVSLPKKEMIEMARESLISELRHLAGEKDVTLEDYHTLGSSDEHHTEIQLGLTEFFRTKRLGRSIIEANIEFFKAFMGPDLNIQKKSYLRIARPGKPEDNIGYHRDTFYGGPPFEVSVVVPFVNLPAESSLSVLSGSHVRPEKDFQTIRIINSDPNVTKGSVKHDLGFLYAPKLLDSLCTKEMQAVPLALGEVLIFSICTVHGSLENRGHHTRWSSDIRLIHALAPIDQTRLSDYYEPLCRSAVTDCALAYTKAQAETKG